MTFFMRQAEQTETCKHRRGTYVGNVMVKVIAAEKVSRDWLVIIFQKNQGNPV